MKEFRAFLPQTDRLGQRAKTRRAGILGSWRVCFVILGLAPAAGAPARAGDVRVLYAGSLTNVMERDLGPAFDRASGLHFVGTGAGSSELANEIKGRLREGDVFISASPKVDESLMGEANGDWVRSYVAFARSPLVIGMSTHGRAAALFRREPWYEALQSPGLRIGRTDPLLDPKGRLTVALLRAAEQRYHLPGLAARVLGPDDNPAQVRPEQALVGELQSGQFDVGFFYASETTDLHIPSVSLPDDIAPAAHYTVALLQRASDTAGGVAFVRFLLSEQGQRILAAHGLMAGERVPAR